MLYSHATNPILVPNIVKGLCETEANNFRFHLFTMQQKAKNHALCSGFY